MPFRRFVDDHALGIAILNVGTELREVDLLIHPADTVFALEEHKHQPGNDGNVEPIEVEAGHFVFLVLIVHLIYTRLRCPESSSSRCLSTGRAPVGCPLPTRSAETQGFAREKAADGLLGAAGISGPVSVDVGNLLEFRVFPKVFQIIMLAGFWHKDVHHHRAIVHCHPNGILATSNERWMLAVLFSRKFFNGIGDGIHLLRRTAGADNEIITRSRRYFREIGDCDVATFFS